MNWLSCGIPTTNTRLNSKTQSRYESAMSKADDSVNQGDFVQGLFHANQALSVKPDDPAAIASVKRCNGEIVAAQNSHSLMSQLLKTSIDHYADRNFTAALMGFEEALRIAPNNALAAEYRDKCRLSIDEQIKRLGTQTEAAAARGDFDAAIASIETALQFKPNDPGLLNDITTYKNRRAEAALAALQTTPVDEMTSPTVTAPNVDAKLLDVQYRNGMTAFDEGDFDGAISSFTKVWAMDPNYHNVSQLLTKAYLFVGMRLYSDHNYTEAIDIWQKALAVDPENNKAKRYLSKAHEELQKLSGVYRAK